MPGDEHFLGKIRLGAATGEDVSEVVSIPKPDGMMERVPIREVARAAEKPAGQMGLFY